MIIKNLVMAASLFLTSFCALKTTPIENSESNLLSFDQWYTSCQKLPKFKDAYLKKLICIRQNTGAFKNALLHKAYRGCSLHEFEYVLDAFLKYMSIQLADSNQWLSENSIQAIYIFKPFVQKLIVNHQTLLAFKGDLHADIHSLLLFLKTCQSEGYLSQSDGFKILRPNTYFIFLGDYVDRGLYGVEVLYTLMRFKLANPEHVILVRGNHEDPNITNVFGFNYEFKNKFSDVTNEMSKKCYNKLKVLYNTLPIALYVGSPAEKSSRYNFIQACHGGLEIGYNPQKFLAASNKLSYHLIEKFKQLSYSENIKELHQDICHLKCYIGANRSTLFSSLYKDFIPQSPTEPYMIGFMWNDFVVEQQAYSEYNPARGFAYNKKNTQEILQAASTDTHRLRGVIRAHQHIPSSTDKLMRLLLDSHGVARLWVDNTGRAFKFSDNLVCTLMLSPQNISSMAIRQFADFTYDTWLLVKAAPDFTQWQGVTYNNQVE